MPRISDDFIDSSIYLYPTKEAAEAGSRIGGSGFLIGIAAEKIPNSHFIYAVTNRHVVENGGVVVRLNTTDGKTNVEEFNANNWVSHPAGDDVAVCGLPDLAAKGYRYKFLILNHLISRQIIEEFNIGPGDDAFVVGRFINHEGRQRNLPTTRFGNIAQLPHEPVRQPRGSGYFDQESFLVEARSIGGYSGSPVFVGLLPLYERPDRPGKTSSRVWLLGIDWGHLNDWLPVCDENNIPIPSKYRVHSNTGMMAVVPAWKLQELLEFEPLRKYRQSVEERILSQVSKSK